LISRPPTPRCTEPATWRKFPAHVHAYAGVELGSFSKEPAFIPFPVSDAVDAFEISPYTTISPRVV